MRLFGRFAADETGNVAMTAGIMLPVLVAAASAAVSYSSGSAARTGMQTALDAAVLAGASASDLSDPAAAIAIARKAFDSNVGGFARSSAKDIVANFKVEGSVLSGEAGGTLTSPFGAVLCLVRYRSTAFTHRTRRSTKVEGRGGHTARIGTVTAVMGG